MGNDDGIISLSTVEGWLFHSREIREKCVIHSSGSAGGAESEKLIQAAPSTAQLAARPGTIIVRIFAISASWSSNK